MIEEAKVEKIGESGYFVTDSTGYCTTIVAYSPILAQQTSVHAQIPGEVTEQDDERPIAGTPEGGDSE